MQAKSHYDNGNYESDAGAAHDCVYVPAPGTKETRVSLEDRWSSRSHCSAYW